MIFVQGRVLSQDEQAQHAIEHPVEAAAEREKSAYLAPLALVFEF